MLTRRNLMVGAVTSAVSGPAAAAVNGVLPLAGNQVVPAVQKAAVLCIGISQHAGGSYLPNAIADAELMAGTFSELGFNSYLMRDPTLDELLYGLATFRTHLNGIDTAAIYVAGHGAFVGRQVHVFPTDVQLSGPSLSNSVPENIFANTMSDTPRHKLLFLDCCRSEIPDKHPQAISSSMALGGLFTLYAAQHGAAAYDGNLASGPFAASLSTHMRVPGLSVDEIARRTRLDVLRATGGAQIPWNTSSLMTEVVLNKPGM
ncbi:MAG: caspase family protein [Pseudomonadota bacterium]